MSVGERIKEARINNKMRQQDVSNLLFTKYNVNVTNTTISNWENGVSKPDVDIIYYLCEILNVDANFLLNWDTAKETNNIKDKFDTLSKENKKIIESLIDKINDKEDM